MICFAFHNKQRKNLNFVRNRWKNFCLKYEKSIFFLKPTLLWYLRYLHLLNIKQCHNSINENRLKFCQMANTINLYRNYISETKKTKKTRLQSLSLHYPIHAKTHTDTHLYINVYVCACLNMWLGLFENLLNRCRHAWGTYPHTPKIIFSQV